jgi:uncharacterized membrane protein YuzA (DUF378 family)
MKSPLRYIIYLLIGMGIYYAINSGKTSFTHEDARKTLLILIVGVLAVMLIANVMKRRHEKKD